MRDTYTIPDHEAETCYPLCSRCTEARAERIERAGDGTTIVRDSGTYCDERLRADLGSGMRGIRVRAELLLRVPFEVRELVSADAWRHQSYVGGRFSDGLRSAVAAWESGHLTQESHDSFVHSF